MQGIHEDDQELVLQTRQYHFDEVKTLNAAVQTDLHYFRVAQYLRLARRAMALSGLDIISVTPGSRLNDYFRYQSVEQVLRQIGEEIGDPQRKETRGLFDVDTGKELEGTLTKIGMETIAIGAQRKAAAHYSLRGDVKVDLWYDANHRLVRQEVIDSGHKSILQMESVKSSP